MNRYYNLISTCTFVPAPIIWSVLRRARNGITRPIDIVYETPDYIEALANTIERRRKTGKDFVYKLMSHEKNKKLDLNSQSVQANFK